MPSFEFDIFVRVGGNNCAGMVNRRWKGESSLLFGHLLEYNKFHYSLSRQPSISSHTLSWFYLTRTWKLDRLLSLSFSLSLPETSQKGCFFPAAYVCRFQKPVAVSSVLFLFGFVKFLKNGLVRIVVLNIF
ncbi:hypothetical protein EUGRSUZ_J02883 [Eucalyptus grandis]|uniref:Uncharacterized protein n=2 Tax=Eucalyptus grandis TaxID=71139 RepID=A0ACC3J9T9_EUCGR|nr:hypothetical protein EUGRSUZ_J02883 [Eucalyptus grandis]